MAAEPRTDPPPAEAPVRRTPKRKLLRFIRRDRTSAPASKDDKHSDSNERLAQTAESLVTFILQSVRSVASNVPGVGAIDVALAIKDKIKLDASNRKEMREILKYIETLCLANGSEPVSNLTTMPDIHLSEELIGELKRASKDLETTKARNRADRIIKAEVIETELKAVWQGIDRSLSRHQLKAAIKIDGMLSNVQRLLSDEIIKKEGERINDVINRLRIANGARYDSLKTQTRIRPCAEGTRDEVLSTIKAWAMSTEEGRAHIFWLNGLAGIGKSTIAMTIAKWAREEKGMLGGSFFFARDVQDLSDLELLTVTLAYQLAQFNLGYKVALYDELQRNPEITTASLESQIDRLIKHPLSASHGDRPIIVVLDALDECVVPVVESVKTLLRALLDLNGARPSGPRLRILITSRPEAHIRFTFTRSVDQSEHEKVVLHEIDENVARNDIRRHLQVEFARFYTGELDLPEPPRDWPPPEQFNQLVTDCGKFFAYAATAIRFVRDEYVRDPPHQLREILRIKQAAHTLDHSRPYVTLDNLYTGVLNQAVSSNAPKIHVERIKYVLATIVFLREPMSVYDLAIFLGATEENIRTALHFLHSVVIVPDREKPFDVIRFFHQSFPDFVQDEKRCTDKRFLVNAGAHVYFMASRCAITSKSMDAFGDCEATRYAINHAFPRDLLCWRNYADVCNGFWDAELWPANNGLTSDAPFYRQNRGKTPCIAGTRTGVLKTIQDWALSTDESRGRIFWLNGPAGSGKSSIAASIAEWARARGILGGSFFLSVIFTTNRVVLDTLKYQVAHFESQRKIKYHLKEGRDSSLDDEVPPFQGEPPVLIILESLEKHSPESNTINYLLRSILKYNRLSTRLKLRIFVTSRPEANVRSVFESRDIQNDLEKLSLQDIDEDIVRNDIRTFLVAVLPGLIPNTSSGLNFSLEGWPPSEQVDSLLDDCGSSFAYAASAVHHIGEQIQTTLPRERDKNWDLRISAQNNAKLFDALYSCILKKASFDNPRFFLIVSNRFQQVIATITCLREPMNARQLAEFLGIPIEDVRDSLHDLHSIVVVPDDPERLIKPFHHSFVDFIQDANRCEDELVQVDVPAHEHFMALQCVRALKAGDTNVMDYALKYWPSHLEKSGIFDAELAEDLLSVIGDKSEFQRFRAAFWEQTGGKDLVNFLQSILKQREAKESDILAAALDRMKSPGERKPEGSKDSNK